MPQHPGRYVLAGLVLVAFAGEAPAQTGNATPSPSDQPTTGTGAPVIKPQPDVHGRADTGQGQQHGNDSASPGSTGGGVSTADPAGSGPAMGSDGAPSGSGAPPKTGQ